MSSIAECESFINDIASLEKKLMEEHSQFISSIDTYHQELEKIRDEYIRQWDKGFNIFKVISPAYYEREKFHSEILKSILDPHTPEIGNPDYLKRFVDLLKVKNKKIKNHDFGDTFKVDIEVTTGTDEKGFIDILVSDDKYALIIENKMNNAPDMDNQLARYFEHVQNSMKREVVAIVYLPLNPMKHPPVDEYYGKYNEYIHKIKEKLIELPAIASDGKHDLVHGFLEPCIDIAKNEIAKFYLSQYTKLVKFRGGENMFDLYQRDIFKEIFGNEKNMRLASDIFDVYSRRDALVAELLSERCIPELQKMNFSFKGNELRMPLSGFDGIYYTFQYICPLGFGFVGNESEINKRQKDLVEILKDEEFNIGIGEDVLTGDPRYVWKIIKISNFLELPLVRRPLDESIADFRKFIVDKYTKLISKTEEMLQV